MGEVLFLSLLHLFSLTCISVSPHGLLLITFLTNEVSLDIVRVGGRGHIKIINILKRDSHLCKIQFKNFLDFWIFFTPTVTGGEKGQPQQFIVRATSKSSSFAYYVFFSF